MLGALCEIMISRNINRKPFVLEFFISLTPPLVRIIGEIHLILPLNSISRQRLYEESNRSFIEEKEDPS